MKPGEASAVFKKAKEKGGHPGPQGAFERNFPEGKRKN